jgi:hypothetical protein
MNESRCDRFEQAIRREDPEAWTELEVHGAGCAECRGRLSLWREIGEAAPALRKAWDSPDLFRRIEQAVVAGSPAARPAEPAAAARPASLFRWAPAAAVAALVVLSTVGVRVFRDSSGREPLANRSFGREPLMTEQALSEVESAEAAYLTSIEKLSLLARPRLQDPRSPFAAGYREKLMLLDSAIAEMRGEIERNRFNTHLRRELLAMYREKQRTLQDLMKVGQS